jgi:hypothetical protein
MPYKAGLCIVLEVYGHIKFSLSLVDVVLAS